MKFVFEPSSNGSPVLQANRWHIRTGLIAHQRRRHPATSLTAKCKKWSCVVHYENRTVPDSHVETRSSSILALVFKLPEKRSIEKYLPVPPKDAVIAETTNAIGRFDALVRPESTFLHAQTSAS